MPVWALCFRCNYTLFEDCIRPFEEICDGQHDALPEQAFMYVGPVEQAMEKAKKLQA